jgi:DNA repair protein RadC
VKYSELPRDENPNFRIKDIGKKALTDSELLAVSLRINEREAAEALRSLLTEYGSLAAIPSEKITSIRGLGEGYANSIQAISELVCRELRRSLPDRTRINSPADAAAVMQFELSALDHEELWVMLLDTRNGVKRTVKVYQGSANSAQINVGEIFKEAIREGATAIVVFHNHPSGDPTPSPDDVAVTRAIVNAGKLMDIDVLDHIVIGGARWVSLKERGLGF